MGKSHFVWLGFAFLAFAVLVAANDVKYWYTYERHAANVVVSVSAFRNIRRMEASLRNARALRLRFSQSLASRRQRFNQAMVRSTIQRLGSGSSAPPARAVIARPQILLADEPTGNVDPRLAQRLLRLFIELNKSGTSVVIATHDIALMDQYDARRLVLHDGRIHVYD
jgi:ABC-type ATPase involved in cell division